MVKKLWSYRMELFATVLMQKHYLFKRKTGCKLYCTKDNNKILFRSHSLVCLILASVLWSYGACELCNKILLTVFLI